MKDTDARLSWMLRVLGDEFGPLGVIRAAHEMWPDAATVASLDKATPDYPPPCSYEDVWTDEVGVIPVCKVHGNNSRHVYSKDPHRPCLTVDPYPSDQLKHSNSGWTSGAIYCSCGRRFESVQDYDQHIQEDQP